MSPRSKFTYRYRVVSVWTLTVLASGVFGYFAGSKLMAAVFGLAMGVTAGLVTKRR